MLQFLEAPLVKHQTSASSPVAAILQDPCTTDYLEKTILKHKDVFGLKIKLSSPQNKMCTSLFIEKSLNVYP